ncbi:MAG: hypothetical protein BWY55_00237 [archaeon ADurb.Bin336]|jgi:hypothetical protein|nr:MAG: hypothetical protein BWY55_00237 [archaeon ADurb.Bin336]
MGKNKVCFWVKRNTKKLGALLPSKKYQKFFQKEFEFLRIKFIKKKVFDLYVQMKLVVK